MFHRHLITVVTDWHMLCLFIQEENGIPSCDLSGSISPSPVIVTSPLSRFYRSGPENGPIIPKTKKIKSADTDFQ